MDDLNWLMSIADRYDLSFESVWSTVGHLGRIDDTNHICRTEEGRRAYIETFFDLYFNEKEQNDG